MSVLIDLTYKNAFFCLFIELGSENVYNSSPGVTDVVQPHDPELESKDNISLTGFEIEMNEEQIVFKRKRRAREIESKY